MYGMNKNRCGCDNEYMESRMARCGQMFRNRSEKDVAEDLQDYKEQLENEISLLERKLARIKSHKNENVE
jgi:chaperonin cofactor prefoldin